MGVDLRKMVEIHTSILRNRCWRVCLATVACLLILLSRAPDVFFTPQFWAEDGSVFFNGAMTHGTASIIRPYAGYLHLVPRLVAILAARFSAVDAPTIYAYAALGITLWCSATIAASCAPAALSLAVAVVAVPGSYDIFGTITNVQWFMQAALLVIVASESPTSRLTRLNQTAFTVLSSLSGPFSILLSPVSAWKLVVVRQGGHGRAVNLIVLAAAAIQICALLTFGDDQSTSSYRPVHLFWVMLSQSLDPGLSTAQVHITNAPLRYTLVVLVIALAQIGQRRFTSSLIAYVLIAFVATWFRALHNGDNIFYGFGERYFYTPRLFIIWCACIAIFHESLRPLSRAAIIGLLTLLLIFSGSLAWRRPPLRVLPWRSLARGIDAGQAVTIVINPSNEATPVQDSWRVEIPARP